MKSELLDFIETSRECKVNIHVIVENFCPHQFEEAITDINEPLIRYSKGIIEIDNKHTQTLTTSIKLEPFNVKVYNDECPVCFDPVVIGWELGCGHTVCAGCMTELKRPSRCMVCRRRIRQPRIVSLTTPEYELRKESWWSSLIIDDDIRAYQFIQCFPLSIKRVEIIMKHPLVNDLVVRFKTSAYREWLTYNPLKTWFINGDVIVLVCAFGNIPVIIDSAYPEIYSPPYYSHRGNYYRKYGNEWIRTHLLVIPKWEWSNRSGWNTRLSQWTR